MKYTKRQLKKVIRRILVEKRYEGKVRRKSKAIHFLINLKSHNVNPYKKNSSIRKYLITIKDRGSNWDCGFRYFLVRLYGKVALSIGKHNNIHEIDDLPF